MRANEWVAAVVERLAQQWPTVSAAQLEDLAGDLWADERLRGLAPETAANEWLRPVSATLGVGGWPER